MMRGFIAGVGTLATTFGFFTTVFSMEWGWWSWVMVAGVVLLVVDSELEESAWRRVESRPLARIDSDPDGGL